LPPEQDAEFVCAMEDVLDVYHRPYDEKRPLIALDESSKQLIGETVQPLPAEPGRGKKALAKKPTGGRRRSGS
jgi:hypothetical protein